MDSKEQPVVDCFNTAVKESEVFLSITRDAQLQKAASIKLGMVLEDVSKEKKVAILSGDENYANILLGCECVLRALIAEIKMWILLKQENPDEAWDQLIIAQMGSVAASRAHNGFSHLEHHFKRLEAIEQLVFPPQVFFSAGLLIKSQKCSICGMEYEDCEHLIGKPYMGEFCCVVAGEVALDHVSVVDFPADKRCRVTSFNEERGSRNRMTWKLEQSKGKIENNNQCAGIVLRAD